MPQDFFNWDDDPDQRRITDAESFRKFFGFPYMDERGMHPWHPSSYERYSKPPMYAPPPEVGPTYDDFNENAEMASIQRPRSGIQKVAAQEQWYPGNDIFAGVPEPGTRIPQPRPQQPQYYGPNINPFPGPPPPQRGIPYGTPSATPPRGITPMRERNYSAPPRRMIQPSMPLGPPGGFNRTLTPSAIPKEGPKQKDDQVDTQKLLEMMKLISGGFGGGTGGGGF